jgi:hypothetical protein
MGSVEAALTARLHFLAVRESKRLAGFLMESWAGLEATERLRSLQTGSLSFWDSSRSWVASRGSEYWSAGVSQIQSWVYRIGCEGCQQSPGLGSLGVHLGNSSLKMIGFSGDIAT